MRKKVYTDQELLKIWIENPEKGSVLLMEKYEKLIWSVCANRLENPEDIKECVNDTFAEFFLEHEKFDAEKSNLKNYLCLIADRKAIDMYRKNLRRENFLNKEAERVKEKLEFSEITNQEMEKLEAALEQLPPTDRKILEMKYYDEMSYQEIGQKLGMNYESVKKRGQRSKKRLLYILLIGLVLALLIACAVAVYKKFYFSDTYGYIWTDDPVYELVNKDAYLDTEYLRYNIIAGRYQNGHLELQLEAEWRGEDEVITKDNFKRIEEELSEMLGTDIDLNYLQIMEATNVTKSALYKAFLDYKVSLYVYGENKTYPNIVEGFNGSTIELTYDATGKLENDSIIVWFGIEDENEIELEFSSLPAKEYTESNEKKELFGGNVLTLGPAVAGEEFTIVNLYGPNEEEFQISPYLLWSRYGLGKRETGHAALTDAQGTVYNSMRISGNDVEEQQVFDIYFPSVPAGEYTLKLPYVCFMKEENSETITLNLPTGEEDYKVCDETVLFADGRGFHIIGIERSEKTGTIVDTDKYGNIEAVTEVQEWVYALEYETISGEGELVFCTALVETPDINVGNGIASGGRPQISIVKDANIESVEIYFTNPVYVWKQELEWKVTVQENE